ncbi:hypothetical protein HK405_007730 [Cladochytrium tenue]|nr:hypothetical protein HK405_007730 [Cladochytrium tenue]
MLRAWNHPSIVVALAAVAGIPTAVSEYDRAVDYETQFSPTRGMARSDPSGDLRDVSRSRAIRELDARRRSLLLDVNAIDGSTCSEEQIKTATLSVSRYLQDVRDAGILCDALLPPKEWDHLVGHGVNKRFGSDFTRADDNFLVRFYRDVLCAELRMPRRTVDLLVGSDRVIFGDSRVVVIKPTNDEPLTGEALRYARAMAAAPAILSETEDITVLKKRYTMYIVQKPKDIRLVTTRYGIPARGLMQEVLRQAHRGLLNVNLTGTGDPLCSTVPVRTPVAEVSVSYQLLAESVMSREGGYWATGWFSDAADKQKCYWAPGSLPVPTRAAKLHLDLPGGFAHINTTKMRWQHGSILVTRLYNEYNTKIAGPVPSAADKD